MKVLCLLSIADVCNRVEIVLIIEKFILVVYVEAIAFNRIAQTMPYFVSICTVASKSIVFAKVLLKAWTAWMLWTEFQTLESTRKSIVELELIEWETNQKEFCSDNIFSLFALKRSSKTGIWYRLLLYLANASCDLLRT